MTHDENIQLDRMANQLSEQQKALASLMASVAQLQEAHSGQFESRAQLMRQVSAMEVEVRGLDRRMVELTEAREREIEIVKKAGLWVAAAIVLSALLDEELWSVLANLSGML